MERGQNQYNTSTYAVPMPYPSITPFCSANVKPPAYPSDDVMMALVVIPHKVRHR
jgi:hypothetical protein